MHWQDVPASVREAVQAVCGAPIVEARTQSGGFSPGLAARILCADGQRFFVKAASSSANADTPHMHRQEARILHALDAYIRQGDLPVPRLIDIVESGTWTVLVLSDVDGMQPTLPWQPGQLGEVLTAHAQTAHALTPAPIAAKSIAEELGDELTGWRTLAAAPGLDALDAWSRTNLDALAALESGWEVCAAGTTLLHTDLRADNLLLTDHGTVLVDWPGACIGAAFVDLVLFAPSVAMQGGPAPAELLAASDVSRGIEPGQLQSIVCAVAGYFTERSLRPAPPGLPTVRTFQAAQGRVARRWLAEMF